MRRRYLRYLIQGSKNNNIVYYTTIDNNTINVSMGAFNVVILSNIYDEMGIITCKGNITVINNQAFYNCSSLTSIQIPNSVRSIGNLAFYNCSSLTSIQIPNSVRSIGERAFCGCDGLTSIEIPNSVTSIGDYAFSWCESLTSIVVDSGNTKYDSRNGCNAIIETASNTLIAGCQNTIIPNSVTSIGGSAFEGCSSLTSIEIPNSVTSIGYCAFYECESLTSIVIPNSVTSIGDRAFWYCSGLSSVYVKATTPPTLGNYVFDNNAPGRKIYVPRASLNAYKTASGWSEYADAIVPYDY